MSRARPLRALLLAAVSAWLLPAGPAAAGTLAFRGDVAFNFGPNLVVGFVSGQGVAQVNGLNPLSGGPITQLSLPAGAFITSTEFPGSPPIGGIQVMAQNGPGSFTALTLSGGGGAMPLLGNARLCLVAPCATATLFIDLPLSVIGAGGSATAQGDLFDITLVGAPWTKGTFTVTAPGATTIVGGFGHGPLLNPGSTAQPGGVLALVTPVLIRTTLPNFEELPSYALLYLEFVPEPGPLLALAPAVAGLAALGRRRLRA